VVTSFPGYSKNAIFLKICRFLKATDFYPKFTEISKTGTKSVEVV